MATTSIDPKMAPPETHFVLYKDGDAWCAVRSGFVDLMESEAGFGSTADEAIGALLAAEKHRGTHGHD
jgi:hypothetical protein